MPHDAVETFQADADRYELQRRRLVPPYDDLYGTAVEALALAGRPVARVLDLGAGTGLLAGRVAAVLPDAELTLLDGAPAMLENARRVLGDRAWYVVADMRDPLPDGPWDAVVSALAVHHLEDGAKRDLFVRVREALAPGGVFVNAEQVEGPSRGVSELYAAWHERGALQAGSSASEWSDAVNRMRLDRCATVEAHLQWLRQAGFADVDCLFKQYRFAVLVARRHADSRLGALMAGRVVAVSRSSEHGPPKVPCARITLLAGLGVEGDAHMGARVKHRSRVRRDPTQPNLRQVHLIHAELHEELRAGGFEISPGEVGENITTRGVDLLTLPAGARLRIGPDAMVEVTGLRNPCKQLDGMEPGLMAATLERDRNGQLVRKAGVMGIVVASGVVRPDDAIRVDLPAPPHRALEPV